MEWKDEFEPIPAKYLPETSCRWPNTYMDMKVLKIRHDEYHLFDMCRCKFVCKLKSGELSKSNGLKIADKYDKYYYQIFGDKEPVITIEWDPCFRCHDILINGTTLFKAHTFVQRPEGAVKWIEETRQARAAARIVIKQLPMPIADEIVLHF